MRNYHLLYTASKPKGIMHINDLDLKGFNPWPITKGIAVDDDAFSKSTFLVEGSLPPTLLGNPISLEILSCSAFNATEELFGQTCQRFGINCKLLGKQQALKYYIINPLVRIDAAKDSNGERVSLYDLELLGSEIPIGTHVFRLSTNSNIVLYSDDVFSRLIRNGLVGTKSRSYPVRD
jgi:hypothetical protein